MCFACDDGDFIVDEFQFENQPIQTCDNKPFIFKINEVELLLLNIDASNFDPNVTPADQPRVVQVNTSNIVYRKYSQTVSQNQLCQDLPPIDLIVDRQWLGARGEIQIHTTERLDVNNQVEGHNHQIIFLNLGLENTHNTLAFDHYEFGIYQTSI